jgi:hypothetical protein
MGGGIMRGSARPRVRAKVGWGPLGVVVERLAARVEPQDLEVVVGKQGGRVPAAALAAVVAKQETAGIRGDALIATRSAIRSGSARSRSR